MNTEVYVEPLSLNSCFFFSLHLVDTIFCYASFQLQHYDNNNNSSSIIMKIKNNIKFLVYSLIYPLFLAPFSSHIIHENSQYVGVGLLQLSSLSVEYLPHVSVSYFEQTAATVFMGEGKCGLAYHTHIANEFMAWRVGITGLYVPAFLLTIVVHSPWECQPTCTDMVYKTNLSRQCRTRTQTRSG